MKVLGLVSSPRKGGNGHTLVENILAGAAENGAETELIRLTDVEIKPCLDCGFCKKEGNTTCMQKDAMADIYAKLEAADAVVFGMPIYYGRPNAPFLGFIDRMYAMANPDFSPRLPKDKKFATVITLGGGGLDVVEQNHATLAGIFGGMFGWKDEGFLWKNMMHDRKAVAGQPESLAEAKAFGKKLTE